MLYWIRYRWGGVESPSGCGLSGQSVSENEPTTMAAKIDAAMTNGINVLMFDWYW
jgi:hypothetical protein